MARPRTVHLLRHYAANLRVIEPEHPIERVHDEFYKVVDVRLFRMHMRCIQLEFLRVFSCSEVEFRARKRETDSELQRAVEGFFWGVLHGDCEEVGLVAGAWVDLAQEAAGAICSVALEGLRVARDAELDNHAATPLRRAEAVSDQGFFLASGPRRATAGKSLRLFAAMAVYLPSLSI